ncbi:MAG: glycosyltransferase family 39 protein, partial [Lamprobacter sp.]|uniref:glycosyltransferase family 39 protein n=1 Tax=Lamprobacter sp. TaxID=3100796 RepID=UPI002B2639F9
LMSRSSRAQQRLSPPRPRLNPSQSSSAGGNPIQIDPSQRGMGTGIAWVLLLMLGVTAWRLLVADLMPVTRDEAYYFDWAGQLSWGYFDHPPAVALLGLGVVIEPGSTLASRLGAVMFGSLALLVLWRLYHASGLRAGNGLLLALILSVASVPGLIAGVITTPDSVLLLCWPLALHEALRALQGQRRRWLTAGIATGLGLLGKYSMVMIGPAFLWALVRADSHALRTPWPYLGGLLALLVFAPNLLWNAHNDWLTLRFQFGHGFSTESGLIRLAADALPAVTGAHAYTHELPAPMEWGERLSSLGGFITEQLLLWGLLLVPISIALSRAVLDTDWRSFWPLDWNLKRRDNGNGLERDLACHPKPDGMINALDPAAVSLLSAAALVPLGLFALVALGSEVEANWAAPYLIGAAPFVTLLLRRWGDSRVDGQMSGQVDGWTSGWAGGWVGSRTKANGWFRDWTLIATAGNLVLVSVYVLYAITGLPPLPDAAARVQRESQGFEELAEYAARLPEPVIADRYQFAAMLNFYQPQLAVSQWPGITRPSEYGRGRIVPLPDPQALRQTGFWLLTGKFSAPEITGFEAVETRSLYSCPDGRFTVVDGSAAWDTGGCDEPANVWRLYRYRVTENRLDVINESLSGRRQSWSKPRVKARVPLPAGSDTRQ